jgi:hypothetical protein
MKVIIMHYSDKPISPGIVYEFMITSREQAVQKLWQ